MDSDSCQALNCTAKAVSGTLSSGGRKVFCTYHFGEYVRGRYPKMKPVEQRYPKPSAKAGGAANQ